MRRTRVIRSLFYPWQERSQQFAFFFPQQHFITHLHTKEKLQKLWKKLAKSSKITIYESDLNLSKITI